MSEKSPIPHIEMTEFARLIGFDRNCKKIVNEYNEYEYYFGQELAPQQFNSALLHRYESTATFKTIQQLSRATTLIPVSASEPRIPHGLHFIYGAVLGIHLAHTMLSEDYDTILATAIHKEAPNDSDKSSYMRHADQIITAGTEYYQDHYEFNSQPTDGSSRLSTVIAPIIDTVSQTISFSNYGDQLYRSGFATICRHIDQFNDTSESARAFDEIVFKFGPQFSNRE